MDVINPDVMLEMVRVKFEYFREKLGVLQIEVPSKRKLMCPSAFLTWWKAGLHMVRCKCRDILM